ncbi:MAG: HD domain-containing protein [Alphaproteobacteria bacterium]|nr:HD domain-containing protein [Alphaproteobacteria bacterium]
MFSKDIPYEVNSFSIDETKTGKKMGRLTLKNPEDNTLLNCVLWEEKIPTMPERFFRTGNIVKILSGTYNETYKNCNIDQIKLLKIAKLGLDEEETEAYWQKLVSYINRIQNEKLRTFVADLFETHKEHFKIAPAAKQMHHNFIGGLLVHTVEVAEFAEKNLALFPSPHNEDDIYAACLLHDFGKLFEYTLDQETGKIDYNPDFQKQWLSHTQYGFTICMAQGFVGVARQIAAHHGRTDWGAIIDLGEKNLEPELYFLHLMDNLSAKFGKISISYFETPAPENEDIIPF